MGRLFDELNNIENCSDPIRKYLIDKGFYESTMNPRYLDGYDYDDLKINRPCLRHDSDINDGYTLRIFINNKDIYFEVETPWSSYETSGRYESKQYHTVEDIDNLLDEICERVIR